MLKKELYQSYCDEFEYLRTDDIIDRLFDHFDIDDLIEFLEFLKNERD